MEGSSLHPPHFRRGSAPESGAKTPQIALDSSLSSSSASSIRQIDANLASSRISLYGKVGCLSKAQELFDNCNARDRVLWNALISAYSRHSLLEEALQSFVKMQDEGVLPNVVTFSSLLKALANWRNRKPSARETEATLFSSRMLLKGEQIHVMSSNKGTLSLGSGNVILNTALVDMYVKFGEFVKAQQVFDEVVLRDAIAWNVLMSGYVRYGNWAEALSCFAQMLEEGLCPDPISFACVLKACAILASIQKGEKIHAQVLTGNLNVNLGNALLDMYVKCGEVKKAQTVFDELDVHDVVSWNSLIGGYVHHGCSDEAFNCLGKMQDEGISPDSVTFTCILKACGSIGLIEE
jgi:pentatricopeptide repeat protein